jgi:hypothetical protein
MADKKISALTASTTPLAGTEVLPIVQSGATVKVSVANLTAGRSFTSTGYESKGDITVKNGTGFTTANAVVQKWSAYAGSSNQFEIAAIEFATAPFVDGGQIIFSTNNYSGLAEAFRVSLNGNIAFPSGKGIDFSANAAAPGATSELLDDYELGTWTPVYQTTGTAFTSVTYAIQIGHYTKVGRQVTVSARMRTSALTVGAATGEVVIGGLPFAPSTSVSAATGVVSGASNFAGDIPLSGVTQASLLYLYYRTAANGADVPLAPADMGAGASANDIFITVTYFV